jgi:hypothetical protein
MIDSKMRGELCAALANLIEGRLTNDEIVLLISAAFVWTAGLLVAGLGVLGLCWLLWKWSRADDTPEWREYWSHGDRDAWPFLYLADHERIVKHQNPAL